MVFFVTFFKFGETIKKKSFIVAERRLGKFSPRRQNKESGACVPKLGLIRQTDRQTDTGRQAGRQLFLHDQGWWT